MTDSTFKTFIIVLASAAMLMWYHHTSQGVGRYVTFNPGYTILDTATGIVYHQSPKDSTEARSWVKSCGPTP